MGRISSCSFAIISLLLISCTSDFAQDTGASAYIVSVGIDYANSVVPTLNGTTADAGEIAVCFEEIFRLKGIESETFLLLSEGKDSDKCSDFYPSAETVTGILNGINPGSEDIVVFFFSGHGDYIGKEAFLACAPTDLYPDYSILKMDKIFEILDLKGCRCLCVIDSCFSGYIADNGASTVPFPADLFSEREFCYVSIIASSEKDSTSFVSSVLTEEGLVEHHSMYTARLLNALGWAHSSVISTNGVNGYLKECPRSMNTKELFNRSVNTWLPDSQRPVMNKTSLNIRIIP